MRRFLLFAAFLVLLNTAIALQAVPQGDDNGNPPCWGSDKPCEDGKYRDYQGKEQPAKCRNYKVEGKDGNCTTCEAATYCARPGKAIAKTGKCQTYCRPKDCDCTKDCS